jgi:peptidoglycan hydrolase-like protein with peptidoglycan-binding domain/DNA invertase Pin-like site-specific DNA recombinase
MRRTYEVPFSRAGLAGLLAALILLCLPGTSIAGGASNTSSALGSGLLQYGAGYGKPKGATPVRVVQRTLRRQGWQPGPVDGLYGPRTKAAVTRFQSAARIGVDGIVGRQTRQALTHAQTEPLRRGAGFAQPDGSPRVRSLQVRLRKRGLRPGPVDGLFGPLTQAAVQRLQRHNGVPANGVVTTRTASFLAHPRQKPEQPASSTETPNQPQGQPQGEPSSGEVGNGGSETAIRTASSSGSGSDRVSLPVVILIGLAALLAGLLAGATLGRRNRVVAGTAVPVAQGVVAEGTANSRTVGRFRGNVHALVLGRRGVRRTPEARYLVSDPAKPEPFWVSQDEVSSISPPARRRPFEATAGDVNGAPVRALGYVSVPPNAERQSAEFDAQLDAIDRYCDEQGWELVEVVRDVETATPMSAERRGLLYALEKIGRKEASCLIVSDLGRLSRSAADLGGIIERLERSDGRLVALDIGLDTASPDGYVAAKALASVSSLEGDRVRKGLAAVSSGSAAVAEPTPPEDIPALKQRIVEMRESGMTLQAIADVLNAEGVPTLRGGAKWRPSSVQSAAGYRRPPKRQDE